MKIAVGISGGVDSAVAAMLLKERGDEVIGVTMTLGRPGEDAMLASARSAAARLGIGLEVFDFSAAWHDEVVGYIRDTVAAGRTPNPCVRCNEAVKFGRLPRAALAAGYDCFATGHYARTRNGRLFRALDRKKDQSYFLYRVNRDILSRTIFPLGEMTKTEVRARASSLGLALASRDESQDFCAGDPKALIRRPPRPGAIIRTTGEEIGRHAGYWNYTVGMRRGLGVGGGIPFYVVELRPETNEVVVGTREESVKCDLDLVETVGRIDKSLPVKVRSAGEPKCLADGIAGVAPGQSAVFYDGDEIVGGGIIA